MPTYYDKLKAKGLCTQCAKVQPDNGLLTCDPCREDHNPRMLARYYRLKADGLCSSCAKVAPREGKTLCASCAASQSERSRDSMRSRYKRLRAEGRCVHCTKDAGGKSRCAECKDKYYSRRRQ